MQDSLQTINLIGVQVHMCSKIYMTVGIPNGCVSKIYITASVPNGYILKTYVTASVPKFPSRLHQLISDMSFKFFVKM